MKHASWLVSPDSNGFKQLDRIAKAHARLVAATEHKSRARTILQAQYQDYLQQLQSAGHLQFSKEGQLTRIPQKIDPGFARAKVYMATITPVFLQQFATKNRLAVSAFSDAFFGALDRHSIPPAFAALRSVMEHVAHAVHAVRLCEEVTPSTEKSEFMAANDYLGAIREILVKSTFATRFDWQAHSGDSTPLRQRKKVEYVAAAGVIDLTAKGTMSAVDKLGRHIVGARNVYEFLCEFTHPNVGSHFGFVEEASELESDRFGIGWKEVVIGAGPPKAFARDLAGVVEEVLACIADTLDYFALQDRKLEALHNRLREAAKTMARNLTTVKPVLFEAYDLCPCLSGKKVKFCCREAT